MQPTLTPADTTRRAPGLTQRSAALISGGALLVMVIAAPFAEMYAFPKLIVPYKPAETARNIIAHQGLFTGAIFAFFLTFFLDVVLSWSLYVLLRPVNEALSLLTAWLRLTYSIIALVALNNLITVHRLLTIPDYLNVFQPEQLHAQAMLSVRAFKNHWYFGLIFFGAHLLLLAYLVYKSGYIPRIFGILLAITGLGYLLTSLRPYLMPDVNIDFAMYTFYGELAFMLWLLIRGARIREQPADQASS